MIEQFLNSIKVYECGLTKVRLGRPHDGGYVVADEICRNIKRVYSFGIGDDVSFELDLLAKYPNIGEFNLFDPTIDKLPVEGEKFKFHKQGIGRGQPTSWPYYEYGLDNLLKMDVEGSEWMAINDMFWTVMNSFSQIIVEFHILHVLPVTGLSPYFTSLYERWANSVNESNFEMYKRVFDKLGAFFTCFHIHANNSLPMMEFGGYSFPPLVEMSFVRTNLIDRFKFVGPFKGSLPVVGLDLPNKTDRPDIIDWYPLIRRD